MLDIYERKKILSFGYSFKVDVIFFIGMKMEILIRCASGGGVRGFIVSWFGRRFSGFRCFFCFGLFLVLVGSGWVLVFF